MKTEIDRDLFRHRLYELMVEQNLSQYDLAREMRISVSALHNWFHLKRTPRKSSINKLCKYFNVDSSYFLKENPD